MKQNKNKTKQNRTFIDPKELKYSNKNQPNDKQRVDVQQKAKTYKQQTNTSNKQQQHLQYQQQQTTILYKCTTNDKHCTM